MRLTAAVGLTVLLLVVAASPAHAQLPVGEVDGVRIFRERGAIVVKFTPGADKLCPRGGDGLAIRSEGGSTFRAPARGRTLRTGDRTQRLDYCRVALARRRGYVVSVPLTQVGAV